jgi:hypothetical protein
MKMGIVRMILLFSWLIMFIFYVGAFLTLPSLNAKIDENDAQDAAWKTAYIFLPVVTAFATFYFSLDFSKEDEDTETMHSRQGVVAFTLSITFHVIAFIWFCVSVYFATYNFSIKTGESFNERVSAFHKVLVMFSTLAVLPVGFVLKRADMKSLSSIGQEKSKAAPRPRKKRKMEQPAPAITDAGQPPTPGGHTTPPSA